MNFRIQEPFVLFLYEFQPQTFRASIEKINPLNFPALKQRINPNLEPDPVFPNILHAAIISPISTGSTHRLRGFTWFHLLLLTFY
jgi:hypothetical protein